MFDMRGFYFFAATLGPALLIAGAVLTGSGWLAAAALLSVTLVVAGADQWVVMRSTEGEPASWATSLSVLLVFAHFAVFALTLAELAHWQLLPPWGQIALCFAAGIYMGQVSHSNAHELIHSHRPILHQLGAWVYISLGYGQHVTAHTAIHHRYAATPEDPNTARLGEGFYRFALRAWFGSFRAGRLLEAERLRKKGRSVWHLSNPYWRYVCGSLAFFVITGLTLGLDGVAYQVAVGLFATIQLLLSDYVQHYGLLRKRLPNGKYEPIQTQHSWNTPHWYSSLLLLNAPRHSDHHCNPSKQFPQLTLDAHAPQLPYSLPVMACLAALPPLWKWFMRPLVLQQRSLP